MKKEDITENPRYVVLGVFIAMAALTAGLIAANSSLNNIIESGDNIEAEVNQSEQVGAVSLDFEDGEFNTTEDGVRYRLDPDELMQGCPNRDCFPSIDDPEYITAGDADEWIDDDERVMNVEVGEENRAYPLKVLRNHEIVNTEMAGEHIAVTYCPLCRSGVVHDREVNGDILEFGVSGKLYQANLIMYDRQTETY